MRQLIGGFEAWGAPRRIRTPSGPPPRLNHGRLLLWSVIGIALMAASAFISILYCVHTIDGAAVRDEVLRAETTLRGIDTTRADATLAARLQRDYLFEGAHFTAAETPLVEAWVAVPVPGHPGLLLAWLPRRFATEIFNQVAPIRFGASALFFFGVALILGRHHRLVTALEAQRQAIAELAARDALTGLGNRLAFDEKLASEGSRALLYIDLDDFKQVNDRFGHGAGDELLRTVASRLAAIAGEGDFVARIGGDEFAILRMGDTTRNELAELAADIGASLSEPVRIGSDEVSVVASIGIAAATGEVERDGGRLVRCADEALYRAKALPGHSFVFAEPESAAEAA